MDLSTIIVVVVLTALSLGAIVGLEVYSRRNQGSADAANFGAERKNPPKSISR